MGSLAPIHWLFILLFCGVPLFFMFATGRLVWNKGNQLARKDLPQDGNRPVVGRDDEKTRSKL